MSTLTDYLNLKGFHQFEGHSQQVSEQVKDLIELTNKPYVNVMEIGFNAGHSAEIFLKNNSSLSLTSFDLGSHDYLSTAKDYIDAIYPNRHTLILGDSKESVPKYLNENNDKKFDVIFIDGGHDYHTAISDLINCKHFAHKDTIVIMDDTKDENHNNDNEYTWGPIRAWKQYIKYDMLTELGYKDYGIGRGMSWGKYLNFL